MNSIRKPLLVEPKAFLVVFKASVFLFLYWLSVLFLIKDIYSITAVGVVYEILWLTMLLAIVVLPVLSIYQLVKGRRYFTTFPFYSLLLFIATIVLFFLKNSVD